MGREQSRNFKIEYNSKGEPYCKVSTCNERCNKFKNGKFRKYCNLHDSYSSIRERHWSFFKTRILLRDNNCCVKCGSEKEVQVDHIIAIMNGGEMWDEENLQTLCKECHNKKTKQDYQQRTKGNKILK